MERQVLSGPPNPAHEPVRTGILLAMQRNVDGAAGRLRWGYEAYGPAVMRAGYGPRTHAQLVLARKKLEQAFMRVGGNPDVLRQTILASLGSAVGQEVMSGLAGKGSPKSGGGTGNAIIDAAMAILNGIFSLLNQAKQNDPNDPVPDEYLPAEEEPEPDPELNGLGALRTRCFQNYVAPLRSQS